MFVRIKKIKGLEYAYLVKNVWKGKTPRQKVVQYLGRVHAPPKGISCSFDEFCAQEKKRITEKTAYPEIVCALFEWTLIQHGFTKDPLIKKKWRYDNGKIVGDSEKCTFFTKKRDVTLKINEGYMNAFTLKELLAIRLNKNLDEPRQAATLLARAFVNAGIAVPQDVFIEIFQRVYK